MIGEVVRMYESHKKGVRAHVPKLPQAAMKLPTPPFERLRRTMIPMPPLEDSKERSTI